MKIFFLVLLLLPAFAKADDATAVRLSELEKRMTNLEQVVGDKLGSCKLKYQFFQYRLNRCDEGTFARAITNVGGNQLQLECGYYQLQCFRNSKPRN